MRRKIPLMAGSLALAAIFAIGGVSAFFTDRINLSSVLRVKANAVNENCIDMNYFDSENDVGLFPGDKFDMSPAITNVSGEDCFVLMEISVPAINSLGTLKPVFSYEKSPNWHLVRESISENSKNEVYCFGKTLPEILAPGESTDPLFSEITFLNLPGNEKLSDKKLGISCKATLIKASKIKYEDNYKDSNKLYDLVLADENEEMSKGYLRENEIKIGKFKVEIEEKVEKEENSENPEGEEDNKKDIYVENKGDMAAVVFLKVRALKAPNVKDGIDDLLYLGMDDDEYVFGLVYTLKEGESTDNLLDKLDADGILETEVLSIQAKNLSKDGVPINTEGRMDKETLKDIYGILSDGLGGFFTDEDKRIEEENTGNESKIEVEEIFDGSKPLTVGDNDYEKRVIIRNTGKIPQYVRVKLGYSEADIEERVFMYSGTGSFVKANELKNILNTGWEYVEEEGERYYVYKNLLSPQDVTSPLFTHVKIVFENLEEVKDFDIFVEAEGRKEAYI